MEPGLKYIGDGSFPEIKKFIEANEEFQKQRDEKVAFLKKQAEAIESERMKLWDVLWKDLQDSGKIARGLKHEDHQMHLTKDDHQLFIKKHDKETEAGFKNFLKGLFE